jgi:hypothetical protein
MQKIRKQRVVRTKNRGNQWTTGRAAIRNPENFTFKMTPDHHEKAAAIIAATGMKKQQLCDEMAELYFDTGYELNPLVATAIADSIFNKECAMKVEKKKRSPSYQEIAIWEMEIETLQSFL